VIEDNDRDWVSDEDLEALNMERSFRTDETTVQIAERLLQESAPAAAMAIVRLATNPATNDRVRLTAATYIIDRTCGKVGDTKSSERSPWDDVYAAVTGLQAQ
jgi:hypothetical protein